MELNTRCVFLHITEKIFGFRRTDEQETSCSKEDQGVEPFSGCDFLDFVAFLNLIRSSPKEMFLLRLAVTQALNLTDPLFFFWQMIILFWGSEKGLLRNILP